MVAGIKHHTQTAKTNSIDYDVSATAWNENHDIDDAAIPQSKVAADTQVIDGPQWSNPTGTGPFVIQLAGTAGLTAPCGTSHSAAPAESKSSSWQLAP